MWSSPMPLTSDHIMMKCMKKNGTPMRITTSCSARIPDSPEMTSIAPATAPIMMPHRMRYDVGALFSSPVDIMSVTIAAESMEVTKKIMMINSANTLITVASGYCSSRMNSAGDGSSPATTGSDSTPGFDASSSKPARPKMENQMMTKTVGKPMTPAMNWRTDRPREVRATNMPTNGDQQMVHAQ